MVAHMVDDIAGNNWVGLASMLVYISNRVNALKNIVLENNEGGLMYIAGVAIITGEMVKISEYIENTLNIRTSWVPSPRNLKPRNVSINVADDYYFRKTRIAMEKMLDEYSLKKGDAEDEPCRDDASSFKDSKESKEDNQKV